MMTLRIDIMGKLNYAWGCGEVDDDVVDNIIILFTVKCVD